MPTGGFIELTPIKQKGGKIVHAWAFEGDCDPSNITSNTLHHGPRLEQSCHCG